MPVEKEAPSRSNPIIALLGFLTATFLVGFVGAQATVRDEGFWYTTLNKPSWTPPAWLFSPVWTVLYILMAVAAWQVWSVPEGELPSGRRTRALLLFGAQLILNGLWSWLFFGFHQVNLALYEIGLLLLTIVATAIAFGRCRASAGWLMAPYVLWVSFALALNFSLHRLNPTPVTPAENPALQSTP
jgi:tryptophan-rich sensory protein